MKSSHGIKSFCEALKKSKNVLLSCHVLPEGDAIGSVLAMESLLRRMEKKTTVVNEDAFPKRLSFMYSKRWTTVRELKNKKSNWDALVVADCAHLGRTGSVQELLNPTIKVFNLDHHMSNQGFGDFNYIEPSASSSGEVVMNIFKYFKMPITKKEAEYLYIAIATDTGSFRYSNAGARTHRLAAELLDCGIDSEKINEEIHTNFSLNKMKLYSFLFSRVKTAAKGQIAWASLSDKDLRRFRVDYEDTEGFVDFMKYMDSVKVAFFVSELPNQNTVRLSFRSRGHYDVNKIATFFKGGGHLKSSGCLFEGGGLEETTQKVLRKIKESFRL